MIIQIFLRQLAHTWPVAPSRMQVIQFICSLVQGMIGFFVAQTNIYHAEFSRVNPDEPVLWLKSMADAGTIKCTSEILHEIHGRNYYFENYLCTFVTNLGEEAVSPDFSPFLLAAFCIYT